MFIEYEREAANLISLGRAYILDYHKEPCAPYIADTLLNLMPVPVPSLTRAPMGVSSGLVLYYNPKWVCLDPQLSQKHIMAACLVHETEHVLRGMWRLEKLPDKDRANIAGDMAINCTQRREGWILPDWVFYPDNPRFNFPLYLTLEHYYELLTDKANSDHGGSTQQMMNDLFGSKEDGQGGGDGGGGEGGNSEGSKKWKPNIGAGGCGSIAGGVVDEEVENQLKESGRSSVEVEAIRRNTLNDIEDWLSTKGIGSTSGRWSELLNSRYKKPDVDWKAILRKTIRRRTMQMRFGSRDYSISRPSISSPFLGVLMPSLIDGEVNIAFIRDTSASMGNTELKSANSEIIGAIKKSSISTCWLIDADVGVHQTKRVNVHNLSRIPIIGRGGTEFKESIEYAMKLRPRPNVIIYLTDGEGSAPARPPPGVTFIWCIIRTTTARRPAWWGTTVVCSKNQKLVEPLLPCE